MNRHYNPAGMLIADSLRLITQSPLSDGPDNLELNSRTTQSRTRSHHLTPQVMMWPFSAIPATGQTHETQPRVTTPKNGG